MIQFLKWLFNSKPKIYWIVDITYSKHGGNYYPKAPKSKSHKGDHVSNQFIQIAYHSKDFPTVQELDDAFYKRHPKASNMRIEKYINYFNHSKGIA